MPNIFNTNIFPLVKNEFPSTDSSLPSAICFLLHSLNLLFLRTKEHKDQITHCRGNLASSILLMVEVLCPTVPVGKGDVLIDLDVKCQCKRWHRDSIIYTILEISECLSVFMLNLRLLERILAFPYNFDACNSPGIFKIVF